MAQKPRRQRKSTRPVSHGRKAAHEPRLSARRYLMFALAGVAFMVLLGWWICYPAAPPERQEKASKPRDEQFAVASGLKILYPFDGTLFPPEIAPPQFRWEEGTSRVEGWTVKVEFAGSEAPMQFVSHAREWTPPADLWEEIKQQALGAEVKVTICGIDPLRPAELLSSDEVSIRTSPDEVGAPIFYREVNLPFLEAVKDPASHIRWRFGAISSSERPPIVLEKLLVCGNCHSFSANGSVLGMDVDYANDKGSYAVCPVGDEISLSEDKIITWSDFRREDGKKTFGLLSQVSPDGRYVVSTVKDLSVFEAVDDLTFSQLFFPIRGILCTYDRETATYKSLPGADDERFVQSNPAWSPDGKYLVFARCEAYHGQDARANELGLTRTEEISRFLAERGKFQYDLYRIPFNEGRGGKAEPLPGASHNRRSNYFARYSPDGRWIVFCQADSFMLLQPDSELFIIPAEGGEARRLECNGSQMNSWHSWSPSSRWLVFSSKALTPYTQLFLAHIDEEGHASPPVVLSWFTAPDMAANIPEFVRTSADAIKVIHTEYIEDLHHIRVADNFALAGQFDSAIDEIQKAIAINPERAKTYRLWAVMLMSQDKFAEAEQRIRKAIELDPDDSRAHWNLAKIVAIGSRHDEAERACRKAVELDPFFVPARLDLANLLLETGHADEAVRHLTEAAKIEPKNPLPQGQLGDFYVGQGEREKAAVAYVAALRNAEASADMEFASSMRAKLESCRQFR